MRFVASLYTLDGFDKVLFSVAKLSLSCAMSGCSRLPDKSLMLPLSCSVFVVNLVIVLCCIVLTAVDCVDAQTRYVYYSIIERGSSFVHLPC